MDQYEKQLQIIVVKENDSIKYLFSLYVYRKWVYRIS